MYPPEAPFPVYDIRAWRGDGWDALSYGRPMDFDRPFFEQFKALLNTVPHYNLFIDPTHDQNSEFTNCAAWNKNCYLVTQSAFNEDCYYGRSVNYCRNCCDCLGALRSERCYQCVDISTCYDCTFVDRCENCNSCHLSSDLRGCNHCIGCHGLVRKEWHILNEPVDQESWTQAWKRVLSDPQFRDEMQKQSAALRLKTPKRALYMVKCEETTGDYVEECRASDHVFNSYQLDHCSYCYELNEGGVRDCMDYSMWGGAEQMYECNACGSSAYHVLFSDACWQSPTELLYCALCTPSVRHCFGCVGLQRQEYCILNMRYERPEYEAMVTNIIKHMMKTGEWGEFFPAELSPFGYNETIASEYFPLERSEVERRGLRWKEETEDKSMVQNVRKAESLPIQIEKVDDNVLLTPLLCQETRRPFKIIRQELAFCRSMGIPLPRTHPDTRHRKRMMRRTPRKLWSRTCARCRQDIQTTYAPESPEIVYCESCYLQTVY